MYKCSLVIPCYNEAATIPTLVTHLTALARQSNEIEVILVDNGSNDASVDMLPSIAEQHDFIRTVRVPVNHGYGYGILQGLQAAKGQYLGWTHADMQTDPLDSIKGFDLLASLNGEFRLVKGKRHGRPLADVFFTIGMSLFDSILFGLPLWDINAQPTLFTRSFYKSWTDVPHDFSLDLYIYALAAKKRATIARFPVYFGKRLHGVSHWNVNWQAKWKFIKRTVDFSLALKKNW